MSDSKKTKSGKSRGLGRGLSALMSDVSVSSDEVKGAVVDKTGAISADKSLKDEDNVGRGTNSVPIDWLIRNPDQPRRYFDPKKLEELTESIRLKGVLQPILVRPIPEGHRQDGAKYQIVAGERRWQSSLKAGLEFVPVLVRELSDQDVLEIGVVENVQRADLNPIEEALAYKALIDQFGRTQDEIATAIGKSRPHITNMVRLLTLPREAQEMVREGKISTGHARAIIAAPDPVGLAQMIANKNMSVRQAEKYVRDLRDDGAELKSNVKSADIRAVETDLMNVLGLKVDLNDKGGKGSLKLSYSSLDQLDDLISRLKG